MQKAEWMQSRDRLRIAILAAYAIGLHGLERMIPAPLPWLRFGLANIITLTALMLYGLRVALTITLIRVLLVSLLTGSFLGPGFVLSLGGGVASTLLMGLASALLSSLFSPVGISLIGSMAHNLTQLTLAYLLFIRRMEPILFVTPLILLLGIITGMVNGMASGLLLKKLKGDSPEVKAAAGRES